MRRLVLAAATGLIVTAILAPSAAGQTARQDSVIGSGTADGFGDFQIGAQSGPSGENPTGQVSTMRGIAFSGPVTCLAVRSNVATVNIRTPEFGLVTLQFYDNSGAGTADVFQGVVSNRLPSDCSLLDAQGLSGPVTSGDIVVTDASPLPTLKKQCKKGGWRTFGVFKNQGDCVSFVATRGRNRPGGPG